MTINKINSALVSVYGAYSEGIDAFDADIEGWYARACYWQREAERQREHHSGEQMNMKLVEPVAPDGSNADNPEAQHDPLSFWDRDQVVMYLKKGRIIDAIKTVRDVAAWSLLDSKNYCQQLQIQLLLNEKIKEIAKSFKLTSYDAQCAVGAKLSSYQFTSIKADIISGEFINAIKGVRTHTGTSLMEAKNYCDTLKEYFKHTGEMS